MSTGKPNVRLHSAILKNCRDKNCYRQDPTANDAALAAALAAWDSGVRVRRRAEPSRPGYPSDAVGIQEIQNANGKLKRSKSSDDDSVGDEYEYHPQGSSLIPDPRLTPRMGPELWHWG